MTHRALAVFALFSVAFAQQPKYDNANELLRPEGYREWVFVGSNLGIGYSDDPKEGSFKNIFIQPEMYQAYKRTGKFPDKTMLVMEVFTPGEKRPPAKVGKFEDKFRGIEVALKDESKFPEKWAYFNFIGANGPLEKARAFPKESCWNCHNQHASVDNVFVQFYPALRDLPAPAATTDERVYRIGGGVSAPRLIGKKEPEYSEEARKAKVNSTVVMTLVVGTDGTPRDFKILKQSGFGLDEQAIQAVRDTWRFEPAKKDGAPVNVMATVEVNMRLLNKDYEGQTVRLTFDGPNRPELVKGQMPVNPAASPAHARVELTVTPAGEPINFNVLEASDEKWGKDILREIRTWRFRGTQENAKGVLHITVGAYKKPI